MHIKEELLVNRERFMGTLMAFTQNEGSNPEDVKQFVAGFLHFVTSAAGGDLTPRDHYLENIVPALKKSGMPLGVVVVGMVQVGMAMTAEISKENRTWVAKFVSEYSNLLIQRWEE